MKIVLVGASGTIGRAVAAELGQRHELVCVGHSSGELQVDMADPASIARLFGHVGAFDALVCTAGKVPFAPLQSLGPEQFDAGLHHKLMGQVNLVLQGLPLARDGGSFTLTSGLLNDEPIRQGAAAATVNGALEGFVQAAALELPRGLRINLVSPTVIAEALPRLAALFRGVPPVSAEQAALGYARSVEGAQTGRIYRIGWVRDR